MLFEVSLPPVHIQVEGTDKQSDAHPRPSRLLPSSHNSGGFLFEFPQMSH